MRWTHALFAALAALAVSACGRGDPAPEARADKAAEARPAGAKPVEAKPAGARHAEKPAAAASKRLPVELVPAPATGTAQEIVEREFARARTDGRRLLVYVGATWCEPCQYFHEAAKAGKLDDAFPGLRLVEFDLDRDRERLGSAGYVSNMIPLLALPRADGLASGEQIEGGIKGAGAVDQIRPRLQALLDK